MLWSPLMSGDIAVDDSEVVFAGYGIVAPEAEGFAAYDSYAGLEVEDKWVLVFRFMPEDITPERRRTLNRYSSLRYKAMVARDRGAHGLIVVTGPTAAAQSELVPLVADASLAGTSLPVISVSNTLGERLVAPSGRGLEQLQSALDGGATVPGMEIANVTVAGSLELITETKSGRNVLGRLPSTGEATRRPFVLVGGHVDHLGTGGGGNSLARSDEAGKIHFGADDNASGVAAILEAAEYLKSLVDRGKLKLERDIVFAAWSGEEMGLLGSKAYVASLQEELGNPEQLRPAIAACLNLDMVGRLDDALVINGVASSKVWKAEIEKRNVPVGLPLQLTNDSYLPTDATSFYTAGVPILSFFTGAHSDYHSPRDVPELLDYDGLARITRLTSLLAMSVAQNPIAPDYVEVEQPETRGERAGLRVSLGTHPDYGADVEGLRLDSVNSGGPADIAGLRGGDIVVELGGQRVENIYDYMFAIDSLKPKEETTVTVQRGRERLTFKITPSVRK